MGDTKQIRVIAYKDGDLWVGQCLEYDIGAQAPDLEQLHRRLVLVIDAERRESMKRHGKPFAGIAPSPAHFQDMWETAAGEFRPRRADDRVDIEMALRA